MTRDVTHYVFYHDQKLLGQAVPGPLPKNFVCVDMNSLPIPDELRIEGLSGDQTRAVYSEYLGILSIKPASQMVGVYTYSLPLKFCQKYAEETGWYKFCLPPIKFENFKGLEFDENKLYGVEFTSCDPALNRPEAAILSEIDLNPDFSVMPGSGRWTGPFKGSVVVKREVFVEFQAWLLRVTVHLLKKYGYRCGLDVDLVRNSAGKYWGDDSQKKVDADFRRGIPHVQERLMAYYFGRLYTPDQWVNLKFFTNEN